MRGKLVVLALMLVTALSAVGRLFEVTEGHEGSALDPDVVRTAGLNRAGTIRHVPKQGDESSTMQTQHKKNADADQTLPEAEDRAAEQARIESIEASKTVTEAERRRTLLPPLPCQNPSTKV